MITMTAGTAFKNRDMSKKRERTIRKGPRVPRGRHNPRYAVAHPTKNSARLFTADRERTQKNPGDEAGI